MRCGMEIRQKKDNIVIEYRASAILYKFLQLHKDKGLFILPVNICPIVVEVVEKAGFAPLFVDIDKKSLCIDEAIVLEKLKVLNIKGILLNHTYGYNHDFSNIITEIIEIRKLIIVEDKCLGLPDLSYNENVDLTLFSTGYAKIVELEIGGGIGVLKNNYMEEYISNSIENEGDFSKFFIIDVDEYLELVKSKMQDSIDYREKIIKIYDEQLIDYSINSKFNNWRYNIQLKDKEKVLKSIFDNGLFASTHYKPLSESIDEFPIAWHLYNHVINLFVDKYFDEEKAMKVAGIIKQYAPL